MQEKRFSNKFIMSYICTACKHGINSFEAVLSAVCGKPYAFDLENE